MFAVLWAATEAAAGCPPVEIRPGFGHRWTVDHPGGPADPLWVVTWQFVLGGERPGVLSTADTRLEVALASGALFDAALLVDAAPEPSDATGLALTAYTATFALTEADVAALAASPVTAVTIERGSEPLLQLGARSAEWRTLPAQVRCVLDQHGGA
ncbi:MAG: hypothetical protein ABMA64_09270 [Myxococcota bacterium]